MLEGAGVLGVWYRLETANQNSKTINTDPWHSRAVLGDDPRPELAVGGSSGHRGHHTVPDVQDLHHTLRG